MGSSFNQIADQTKIEDCVTYILESYEHSTKVVGWYAHPEEVRGPFGRWLTVSEVSQDYKVQVAPRMDDSRFASACMNYGPKLAVKFLEMQAQLEEKDKRIAELEGKDATAIKRELGLCGDIADLYVKIEAKDVEILEVRALSYDEIKSWRNACNDVRNERDLLLEQAHDKDEEIVRLGEEGRKQAEYVATLEGELYSKALEGGKDL